jgi:hydrogenase nickel incorporation protein HypA/HybF
MIKRCPVAICCLECGFKSETLPNRLICGHCGAWRTRVIAGAELRLLRVEMRMPESIERRDNPRDAEQIGYV